MSAAADRGGAPDVAVVGGGIVGTAAAAILAGAGARVVLYEREALGAGASGRNSGVVQRPFDPALVPLYVETVALYRELEASGAGFALGGRAAGLLLLDPSVAVARAVAADLAATFPDLGAEALDAADVARLEPALAPDLAACRVPIGFPVPPSAATYAYATLAERRGAVIRLGRAAVPAVGGGRAAGVRVDGRLEPAGAVLVAAGPWSPALLDPTGRWRPITRLWGVVVETLLGTPPGHVLEEAAMDEALGTGAAVAGAGGPDPGSGTAGAGTARPGPIPASPPAAADARPAFSLVTAAGVSVVGSTFVPGDAEPGLAAWEVRLLEHGARFVPAIADAPIRGVRACARPVALDERPLLGAVPGVEGLYVAAGHGPWGISTGPASARIVVDAILGRAPAIAPALDAARFGSPFG